MTAFARPMRLFNRENRSTSSICHGALIGSPRSSQAILCLRNSDAHGRPAAAAPPPAPLIAPSASAEVLPIVGEEGGEGIVEALLRRSFCQFARAEAAPGEGSHEVLSFGP
jgi:hypothetical protein